MAIGGFMDFSDIFGNFLGKNPFSNLSVLDQQQAEEATRLSGATDPEIQKVFYRAFCDARESRNKSESVKI